MIKDDLLHRLLYTPDPAPTTFSSGAQGRATTLLDAVDLDNVLAMSVDPEDSLRDVPGGTLSFLFQKDSTIVTDDEKVHDDEGDEEEVFVSGGEEDSSAVEVLSE